MNANMVIYLFYTRFNYYQMNLSKDITYANRFYLVAKEMQTFFPQLMKLKILYVLTINL